jgi:TonB family protein
VNDKSFHDDDDDTPIRATTVRASKGGGAGKWLLGGLVAVVLGGAGYLAWKNYAPTPAPETQTAYNDPYAADTQHAAPLPPTQNSDNPASPDESVAPPAAASTTPAAAAPRAATRSAAAKPAVPEEVIGITPASATTDDTADENIIVNAPTRPVWSRTPSARRLAALYPVVAQEQGREGEAELHCTVQQNGALDCVRVTETRGFGNAALRVASTFRHAPQLADGRDAAGTPVNLRVLFRLPPEGRRS